MYPKKELPFFILFTAGLCSVTALLALLTHSYPESMGAFAKTVSRVALLSCAAAALPVPSRRPPFLPPPAFHASLPLLM